MATAKIPGFGCIDPKELGESFLDIQRTADGLWQVGQDGVQRIVTPLDQKTEFIVFGDKTIVNVKSAMGHPALYPLQEANFEGPAEAVLMDLDGTSVHSESFWMWVIEQATARLLGDTSFALEESDIPHVSGNSVSEHLQYCIDKYCPGRSVEEAKRFYFSITDHEMRELVEGRGREGAFTPAPGLKEFLLTLRHHGIKVGLVTSGLYQKAWPEILSAFQTLGMGDPLDFYDAVITAGQSIRPGQAGTLGELAPKPHPWLYAETARIGLGIDSSRRHKIIGIEDSSAGVMSIRLAGFAAIGIGGGNINASGMKPLLCASYQHLMDALPLILGEKS